MHRTFLKRFIANPRQVGSVIPSGEALVRHMLQDLPIEAAATVVELGPGVGTFTARIVERLAPGAAFYAIELDHVFAAVLRDRFPRVQVLEDSAEHVARLVRAAGGDAADIIVSGLPFANLPLDFRARVIAGVRDLLRPGGHFVTYQYAHARAFSNHLEQRLRDVFPSVDVRFAMANMPPAFVFHARA